MHVRLWDFGTLKSHSIKVSVQIFIQAAKMEEDFLYLSKITKNESKIIFFDICKFSGINLPSKMQFYLCTKERSHPTCQQNVRLTTAHLSQIHIIALLVVFPR